MRVDANSDIGRLIEASVKLDYTLRNAYEIKQVSSFVFIRPMRIVENKFRPRRAIEMSLYNAGFHFN